MTKFDNNGIKKWNACEIKNNIDDNLKTNSFIINLNLATPDTATRSAESFIKEFSKHYKEYGCDNGNGKFKTTYKYVFVTILDDDVVAVVGKTTFHRNLKDKEYEKYALSGEGDLGDIFKAYKHELTARLIALHFNINIDSDGGSKEVDMKVKQVVIIPIKFEEKASENYDCQTKKFKEKASENYDCQTKKNEEKIGNFLLNNKVCILNGASHLH